MAKGTERLTALQVQRLKEPGYYTDGAGLVLQVAAGGSKSWLFRFRFGGKLREMGLGGVLTYSLAEARGMARDCRKLLDADIDPIEDRKANRTVTTVRKTFAECAATYITMKTPEWSDPKNPVQWKNSLENYAFPTIGKMPVARITLEDVMAILTQPIKDKAGKVIPGETLWTHRTETAGRVRLRLENILDWATASKLRKGENPARWKGHLDKLLPAPGKVKTVEHFSALPFSQMFGFMQAVRAETGNAARALELTILTAARTTMTLGAHWDEFDFDSAVWTVPAARMKGVKGRKVEHRCPLSPQAVALLKTLPRTKGSKYVFPGGKPGKPLSDMSMLQLLKRMGRSDLTVHGFRSSFKDWASEQTAFPGEVSEMALSHKIESKVEGAYRRGDLLEKRVLLMQEWANYCDREPMTSAVVTPIRGAS
jgi:integrase